MRVLDRDPALRATIHSAPELEELRAALQFLETVPQDALARHLAGGLDLFSYRLDAWITGARHAPAGRAARADAARARARRLRLGRGPQARAAGAGARAAAGRAAGRCSPRANAAARSTRRRCRRPRPRRCCAAATSRNGAGSAVRRRPRARRACGWRVRCSTACARASRWRSCSATASSAPCTSAGSTVPARLPARLAAAGAGRGAGAARVRDRDGRHRLAPAAGRGHADDRGRAGGGARAVRHRPRRRRRRTWRTVVSGEHRRRARAGRAVPRRGGAVHAISARRSARASRPRCWKSCAALDQAVDALGDALTAEGVYQAVRGNTARAAASVDALAHGEIQPPELEVVQTPRTGRGGHAPAADAVRRAPAPAPLTGVARRAGAGRAGARAVAARRCSATCATCSTRAEYVDAAGAVVARKEKLPLGMLVASPLDLRCT